MSQNIFFKNAYINLLRTFEININHITIEKVLNFVKDNRLGGDNDYILSADYIADAIDYYLDKEDSYYENEANEIDYRKTLRKLFCEENLFSLIREQILRDADKFLNSYFNSKREIYLSKVIDLKNNERFFYIENQEEALKNLETFISDINYEELDQEAKNARYKTDYKEYFAFKFLTKLLYQSDLKNFI